MSTRIVVFLPVLLFVACSSPEQTYQQSTQVTMTPDEIAAATQGIWFTDSAAHASYDTVADKPSSNDIAGVQMVPYDSPPAVIRRADPASSKPFLTDENNVDRVIVSVWVTKDGTVRRAVLVSSTNSKVNKEALRLSMAWQFKPPFMLGHPVACWVRIPFRFEKRD